MPSQALSDLTVSKIPCEILVLNVLTSLLPTLQACIISALTIVNALCVVNPLVSLFPITSSEPFPVGVNGIRLLVNIAVR
jgi:hypothetical protein